MSAAKPSSDNPLDLVPIASHLRGSAVLKMLHEDNPGFGSQEFIPTHDDDKGPSKGQRSRANWPVSRRQVCWPPKPDYIEVPPSEDSSNQVPPANQATANHTTTNKSTPSAPLANHAPVTQVAAVNRVAAAAVNQIPIISRVPERPAAIPATTVVVPNNQEQPSLPPTGAKVPPPIPPRPANYPQVSMEVQQQALQQVNGQMQQQSMMNSLSSSSSRQEPSDSVDSSKVANGPTPPTVNTQFPAGFKMREQAPVQQTPPAMILSQPAFKISQPLKQKGESKWPPKDNVVTQEQVREFTKPKGGKRDYSEFFAQNALPQTFCSYRAPPGTQHHGEGETGVSEM